MRSRSMTSQFGTCLQKKIQHIAQSRFSDTRQVLPERRGRGTARQRGWDCSEISKSARNKVPRLSGPLYSKFTGFGSRDRASTHSAGGGSLVE